MSVRGRHVPGPPVRHRAGRPAAQLPAGRPRHHARGAARRPAAEGALGRGLVDPSAARRVAHLRGPGRGAAGRAARHPGRRSWSRRARTSGPPRSSPHWRPAPARWPSRAPTRGAGPPASTGYAAAAGWRTWPSSGTSATRSPGTATGRRRRSCPMWPSRSWRPRSDPDRVHHLPDRRASSDARRVGTCRSGWPACSGCPPSGTPSCRRCTSPAPVPRSPGCGWPRTRSPPRGSTRGARGAHRAGRPSTSCRPRTCSPRTTCAGWPGRRRIRSGGASVDAALAELGARPWQRRLTVPASQRGPGRLTACLLPAVAALVAGDLEDHRIQTPNQRGRAREEDRRRHRRDHQQREQPHRVRPGRRPAGRPQPGGRAVAPVPASADRRTAGRGRC